MLKAIWTRFSARSPKNTLADLLSDKRNREMFLGVLKEPPPTDARTEKDAQMIVRYSQSDDYAAWAREVWDSIILVTSRICRGDLTEKESDFYRGKLAGYLDLLRLSHLAREKKIELSERKKSARVTADTMSGLIP